MAAPSKSFTLIPDGDIDPDSPLTTGLFTSLRDNDVHIEEWLGDSYVAAADHDHDGVNSAVASRTSSVFDQITNQSANTAGVGAVDVATITVASADLPENRQALVIASGAFTNSGGGAYPALGSVRLVAAGVAKQSVAVAVELAGYKGNFALSEIIELTGGASRIIKVEAVYTSGPNIAYSGTNLFSVLIT